MKKTVCILRVLIGIAIMGLTSCVKEDEGDNGRLSAEVKFTGNLTRVLTRVSGTEGTNWDTGDPVGLYMIKADPGTLSTGNILAGNKSYNASAGTTTTFSPDDDTSLFYPSNGDGVKFIAYHPYGASVGIDYTLPVSVGDQSNLSAIDVLYAPVTAAYDKTASAPVSLQFGHKLSKLVFNISNGTGVTEDVANGITVSISKQQTTATLDLTDGMVTASDGTLTTITATGAATVEAIVLPAANLSGVEFTFTNHTGQSFAVAVPDGKWLGGYKYTYTVTLKGADKQADIAGEINPWKDGGNTPLTGELSADIKKIIAWANDTEKTLDFTATGEWTATVIESMTRAGGNDVYWLRLLSGDMETYSGSAGTHTLVVELDPNTTGEERYALITIDDGTTQANYHITQAAMMENGGFPQIHEPNPDGFDIMLMNYDGHGRAFAGVEPDMGGFFPDVFYPRAVRGVMPGKQVFLRSTLQAGYQSALWNVMAMTGEEQEPVQVMDMHTPDGIFPYFIMPEGNVIVEAIFVPGSYTVTVTAGKGCKTAYAYPATDVRTGDLVELRAGPSIGYTFAEWRPTGNTPITFSDGYTRYNDYCYIIMPIGDMGIEAVFTPISASASHKVVVTKSIEGGLSALASLNISGAGAAATLMSVDEDNVVYLTATPAEGYTFAGWVTDPAVTYAAGHSASKSATAIIMPRAEVNVMATFVPTGAAPYLGSWSTNNGFLSVFLTISGNRLNWFYNHTRASYTIENLTWVPVAGSDDYPEGYCIRGTVTNSWIMYPPTWEGTQGNSSTDRPGADWWYLSADKKTLKQWSWNGTPSPDGMVIYR